MSLLKFGHVWNVKPGFAKVYFREHDHVSDWLPVLVRKSKTDKESWTFETNEQVLCYYNTELNEGVILGAIHSDLDLPDIEAGPGKYRKVFSDGSIIEYDKESHLLTGKIEGKVIVSAKDSIMASAPIIEAKATEKVLLEADLIMLIGSITFSGNLTVSGEIQASEVKAGEVSLKTHRHTGVETGSGTTGNAI